MSTSNLGAQVPDLEDPLDGELPHMDDEWDEDPSEEWQAQREAALGFRPQKENPLNRCLPLDPATLDRESLQWFKEIKTQLCTAVALREIRPGLIIWMSRLSK